MRCGTTMRNPSAREHVNLEMKELLIDCVQLFMFGHVTMFAELYGKKAAALYTQAQDYQKTARFYYGKVRSSLLYFAFHRPPIHTLAFYRVSCLHAFTPHAQCALA